MKLILGFQKHKKQRVLSVLFLKIPGGGGQKTNPPYRPFPRRNPSEVIFIRYQFSPRVILSRTLRGSFVEESRGAGVANEFATSCAICLIVNRELRETLREISTQLLQRLSGLVQKTMDTKNDTKETMDPYSKNNRAVFLRDPVKLVSLH